VIPLPALAAVAAGGLALPATPPVPVDVERRPIGCRASAPTVRTSGSASRRLVALTFDDGPGLYTARVLDVLRRRRVRATFFMIGSQVRGAERVLRRMLADGHALGNHTFTHANVSGGGWRQMASTQAAIRRATGYTPCVFRPPYGASSGLLSGQARQLGMNNILWNVDTFDWRRPGSWAIRSRAVGGARPGAIILLHDGGGPRAQTVAALPGIITTLRARGYGFATVPELLRLAPRYARPPRPPAPRPRPEPPPEPAPGPGSSAAP
jgi:peptidoglycan/xylan/chitin deacetylase (PgdA/CDA1 family)